MQANTIFANSLKCLDNAQIAAEAPAVFTKTPHPEVSARYGFVDTSRVIEFLRDDGYQVRSVMGGMKGRSKEYGMHAVFLSKPFEGFSLKGLYPEIVFTNSHDRTSHSILQLGLFRVLCLNSMIAGSSSAGEEVVLTHIGDLREKVLEAARYVTEAVPRLANSVDAWSNRKLSPVEAQEFTRRAFELRFSSGNPIGLGNPNRHEDTGSDLWHTYNRVQEHLIRGGFRSATAKRRSKVRPLRAVRRVIDLNKSLWNLAEEFLPA